MTILRDLGYPLATWDDEGELATDDEGEMDPLPEAVRDDWTAGGQAMTCRRVQAQWRGQVPAVSCDCFSGC